MFIQIENNNERITFDDVEKIIFHTEGGELECNVLEAISYNGSYVSFTLIRKSSESTFNNTYRIVTAIR